MRRSLPARLRPRFSPANVVSTLCLFASLGGGAYAATQVDGATLRDRSVPGAKLKQGTVTKAELAGAPLRPTDSISQGDFGGTYGAPRLKQPAVKFVAQNPGTTPDVCSQGQTAVFCANWFNHREANYQSPYGTVGFWKDAWGVVHLFGELMTNKPAQEAAFILPTGYQPANTVQFSVARWDNPSCTDPSCDGPLGVVRIDDAGIVTVPVGFKGGPTSQGDGFALDGIRFKAG